MEDPVKNPGGRPPDLIYTLGEETLPLTEWARRLGVPRSTVWRRIHEYGWDLERALTTGAKPPPD